MKGLLSLRNKWTGREEECCVLSCGADIKEPATTTSSSDGGVTSTTSSCCCFIETFFSFRLWQSSGPAPQAMSSVIITEQPKLRGVFNR